MRQGPQGTDITTLEAMSVDADHKVPDSLWKVTIKLSGGEKSETLAFDFCRKEGIIGVGWGLPQDPDDPERVKQLCRKRWGRFPAGVNALVNRMSEGEHAWVYGDRQYWVCRIDGDWTHEVGSDPWDACDIHHYRDATWKPVPTPLVPGVVKRALFQQGTTQKMRKGVVESTRVLSGWLFAQDDLEAVLDRPVPFEEVAGTLSAMDTHVALQLLGPDEVEDVAGLFVQNEGWRMIKSSTYDQKRTWECEFSRSLEGEPETAYMQVKSGDESLKAAGYVGHLTDEEWLYLVSTARTPYPDRAATDHERVVFVEPTELLRYAAEHLAELPPAISLKFGLVAGVIV